MYCIVCIYAHCKYIYRTNSIEIINKYYLEIIYSIGYK